MQTTLFGETADAGPPGDDQRTLDNRGQSARGRRHTIRERRALARHINRLRAEHAATQEKWRVRRSPSLWKRLRELTRQILAMEAA